jgi:hypothetical protein
MKPASPNWLKPPKRLSAKRCAVKNQEGRLISRPFYFFQGLEKQTEKLPTTGKKMDYSALFFQGLEPVVSPKKKICNG